MNARAAQIQSAADHSDELADFQDQADAWVIQYAKTHRTFIASRCTTAAALTGFVEPNHGAWGAVFKRAQANGTIKRIDYMRRPNGNPTPLYASRVFEDAVFG